MRARARWIDKASLAAAAFAVIACGSVGDWHVDAYNSTAKTLIFRVSSSAPASSWSVRPGESISILQATSRLTGQITLLDPDTCASVASASLPIKAGSINAIYGPTPPHVAIEFAPDPTSDRAMTLPNSTACP